MILVYSEKKSPRLSYILDYFFKHLAGVGYEHTTDVKMAGETTHPLINYSTHDLPGLQIVPSGFLYENEIRKFEPVFPGKEDDQPELRFAPGEEEFDVFAACFYFLSRYEEYLSVKTDNHGRFLTEVSILYRHNLLMTPLVDIWANRFLDQLCTAFPGLEMKKPAFNILSTIDLDNGFKYRGKGFKRTVGAAFKDLKSQRFKYFFRRMGTVLGMRRDEYDIYEWLIRLHREMKIPLMFFVLNARFGKMDRGLPQNSRGLREIVKHFTTHQVPFGIHPSYKVHKIDTEFAKEIDGLQRMSSQRVRHSRQHYLKFSMPDTYRMLMEHGITDDYSMGFAPRAGFRAATSRSFYFYDLKKEESTGLLIHPITLMEGTYKDYLRMRPSRALDEINKLISIVRHTEGTLLTIWHEAQLSQRNPWKGIYLGMVESARNAYIQAGYDHVDA
jgi:hypothetical protein